MDLSNLLNVFQYKEIMVMKIQFMISIKFSKKKRKNVMFYYFGRFTLVSAGQTWTSLYDDWIEVRFD